MELDLIFEEKIAPGTTSAWDKTVPIIAKGNTVTAYLMSEVYEPEVYNELCYTLEHTDAEQVRLMINNNGGQLDAMLSILDSMSRCNCEIVGVLSGSVASAATMIALSCDKLEVAPHTSFMIHSSSGGVSGKTHETKAYMDFSNENTKRVFNDIYKNFLTQEEIDRVLDGKDMWLNTKDIKERFARMKNA